MAKHDRAKQEKRLRNLAYAVRFRQYVCKECGHRTSRAIGKNKKKCPVCHGEMRPRRKQ